jgi:urea carboxylase
VVLAGGAPVIAGPDGPGTGGATLLAVVIRADRWRLAQCRPGDRVRLLPVTPEQAQAATQARTALLAGLTGPGDAAAGAAQRLASYGRAPGTPPTPLRELAGEDGRPAVSIRRAGDQHLLVQDDGRGGGLAARVRMHLLGAAVTRLAGVAEVVPGPRSLLVSLAESGAAPAALAGLILAAWRGLPDPAGVELDAREVLLPIAFDDPTVTDAVRRYTLEARVAAPWCPDNVEYLRERNSLASRSDVFTAICATGYLVLGFSGAGLGSPVAVALDPRHRLRAPRYDPPRSWTPGGAVGLAGDRLRIQGADGPGDSQLVGRTIPIWRDPRRPIGEPATTGPDEPPWLLRPFDVLRFQPVGAEELAARGALPEVGPHTTPLTLRIADLLRPAARTVTPA